MVRERSGLLVEKVAVVKRGGAQKRDSWWLK
jgi:hypothetical protein